MKHLIFLLVFTFAATLHADLGTPRNAAETTIRIAQSGKIVGVDLEAIKNKPKHSWTAETLLDFLKDIDPDKLVFESKDKNIYWFSIDDKRSLVRLIEPRRIDFEVSFIEDKTIGCGGYFLITSIHP